MIVNNTSVILLLVLTLCVQVQGGEIHGGHEAVPHSRPYMVILERHTNLGKRYCDGFLLNEEFILTAAHCNASSYNAFLGVHNVHDPGKQVITVGKSFPHEEYHINENNLNNDIMLLKLSMKAELNENVRPIGFAGQGDYILPHNCLVPGWGKSDEGKGMSNKLMEVNVTVIKDDKCAQLLYNDTNAENHFYCSLGNKGPAGGDSGGPLVCEDGLAHGLVSFVIPACTLHEPIYGFTKIADYKEWIERTMKPV